jgi:signal transduction histidine kinase
LLLVVVVGAVLPLALVGWWLTRAAVRSGEDQLRAQLDSSLAAIASRMQQRWVLRRGELILLADNELARRTLAQSVATPAESAFMRQLFASVERTIPMVRYRTTQGGVRWAVAATPAQPTDADTTARILGPAEATFPVRLPVRGVGRDSARTVGYVEASVRLSGVLPTTDIQSVVGHAALTVVDRGTRARLIAPSDQLPRNGWVSVRRVLDDPPLEVELGAPATAYVRPFERAAQLGLVALIAVATLVLLLSSYLTTRMTSSLEELVVATDAVAHGNLQHIVPSGGDDEVARLAESFNMMTESLRGTLQELSHRSALAAVGEFAATLSHEVRNALSAVRMDLQRAEERADDPAMARALVLRALESVRRLDGIVTGALRVARQGQSSAQRIDLRDVLRRTVASAEPAFAHAGSTLDVRVGENGPLWVDGDASALEQLFLNLVLNAGQAISGEGSARIDVSAAAGSHVVTIHDTGVGMSPEHLARAGQPFYSSKQGGTGLGLTIARRIIAAHGGRLDIESEAGRGTLVRVSLPTATS